MKNLTKRQEEILDLIKAHILDLGLPPTRADIARSLGFKSPNAAEQHLRAIEKKGFIKILSGASRGIVLNENENDQIPVIGLVAAGGPILAEENVEKTIPRSNNLLSSDIDYYLRVKGDSMVDIGIFEEDLIGVSKSANTKVGSVVVARINNEFVINPSRSQLEESDIDIMVGASYDSVSMVEGEFDEISEEDMTNAIKFGHDAIKNQIEAGAQVIQIFDSWAGLLEDKIPEYIYIPTLNIVEYVKKLGVPVICFPRGIKDYKNFCEIVKPDAVNIDYDVDPKRIVNEINIPIQGGLDPKILLTDQKTLKIEVEKYLSVFKDHPYIFNLGHGILPETKIEMVEELITIVRNFK